MIQVVANLIPGPSFRGRSWTPIEPFWCTDVGVAVKAWHGFLVEKAEKGVERLLAQADNEGPVIPTRFYLLPSEKPTWKIEGYMECAFDTLFEGGLDNIAIP